MRLSKRFSSRRAVPVVLLACVLAGCAPKQLAPGVPYLTAKRKVTDAKYQRVKGYPSLRVDDVTLDQLDHAEHVRDLDELRGRARRFVDESHANALAGARNELDRLDDAGWRQLNARYFDRDAVPDAPARERAWDEFVAQATAQRDALVARIESAHAARDLHRLLGRIESRVEPSVKTKGRFARALPWLPFTLPSLLVVRNIHRHEYRGPQESKFASSVWYAPDGSEELSGAPTPPHWDLLRRWAPTILQEQPTEPPAYDPSVDRFGRVVARGVNEIAVDTDRPTVYAYAREIDVGGVPHVQLMYTHWFPQHPKLKPKFDAEQGHLEGLTLRITLDREQRPAIFETVYNCGCYHRLYPGGSIEQRARQEFGQPQPGKALAVERNVKWKIDMIVPKAVAEPSGDDGRARPMVRSKAGWHGLVDVSFAGAPAAHEAKTTRTYALVPYDELERLPLGGLRYTSMFHDNGLVRGAQRVEGIFFTPIGILSAGQPRQRGTQLIHWDHWDFDDPHLFDKALRLPSDF